MGCGRAHFDVLADSSNDDVMGPDAPAPLAIRTIGVWPTAPTDNLSRTLATSTSRVKFTFASWYKSSTSGNVLFDAGVASTRHAEIVVGGTDAVPSLDQQEMTGEWYEGGPDFGGAQFPYVDSWVHLVVALDTTQVNQADRVRWWIDGQPMSVSSGVRMPFPQDWQMYFGDTIMHVLGNKYDGAFHWSGSLAETYIIWGEALDPSAFVTMTADGLRSIAYTGPVTAESVYFDYAVPGQNLMPGQPDWTNTGVLSSTTYLPY
jgi:hypothetical protein